MTTEIAQANEQGAALTRSPDEFISRAIESGAPVETLEKLMSLKERHDANEAKKAFTDAMSRFQQIKPVLEKDQDVSFGQGKTAYSFASLGQIEKQLKEPLEQCGLTYRFQNLNESGHIGIRCIVTHVDGHSEYTELYAPADDSGNKNAIQGIGSTSTYLMRYTIIAAFALSTADEDDDGAASGDFPLQRVMEQNAYFQDPDALDWLSGLKRALAADDYEEAYDHLRGVDEDFKKALWLAPTKGGLLTTEERGKIKSDAFTRAMKQYHNREESNE